MSLPYSLTAVANDIGMNKQKKVVPKGKSKSAQSITSFFSVVTKKPRTAEMEATVAPAAEGLADPLNSTTVTKATSSPAETVLETAELEANVAPAAEGLADPLYSTTVTMATSSPAETVLETAELEANVAPAAEGLADPLNSIVTESTSRPATSKKPCSSQKKVYVDHFSDKWLQNSEFKDWLVKSKDKKEDGGHLARCRVCEVNLPAHKKSISLHGISSKHKEAQNVIKSNVNIAESFTGKLSERDKVKRAEILLSAFIADSNLPFKTMDTLSPLLSRICPDSAIAASIACRRTKTHSIIENLGEHFSQQNDEALKKKGNFFSLIIDETTDRSTVKQCALMTISFDAAMVCPRTKFLSMIEITDSTAEGLFGCLVKCLEEKGIPFENAIGFSADTTNVMFGVNHSVATLLKEKNPNIIAIKCSCHSIHLAASHACEKLPQTVEELLRDVPTYFHRSSARVKDLEKFQALCEVATHKILSKSPTRWLSTKECVDRLLEQYDALHLYFKDKADDDSQILKTMNNRFTKVYLLFMKYILGELTHFNKLFQSEHAILYKLKPAIKDLFATICNNFLKEEAYKGKKISEVFVKNPQYYLPLNRVYLSLDAEDYLLQLIDRGCTQENADQVRVIILSFYVELASQIKQRFSFVETDPIFKYIDILDPKIARSKEHHPTLAGLFREYPILKTACDASKADSEWRSHRIIEWGPQIDQLKYPEEYWRFVLATDEGKRFENLKVVISFLMVLPFSNAGVERHFSRFNLIKTSNRSSLNEKSVVDLMHTKEGLKDAGGLLSFEPPLSLVRKKLTKQ